MRLVRFLAAGKSLVGLKDNEGRYRLPNGRALPRFGAVSDAVAPAVVESAREPLQTGTEVTTSSAGAVACEVSEAVGMVAEQPSNPPQHKPAQRLVTGHDKKRSVFRKLFGWLPWCRENPEMGGIPAFSRLPVQTELSLENVKVVRNDLSESDFEFQSTRNKPALNPFLKRKTGEQVEIVATPANPPATGAVDSGN